MKQAKIAVIGLGHHIYFSQFPGLKEELMAKNADFVSYIDSGECTVCDAGYVTGVEEAFVAVQALKKEDPDLLFILLSTYVPSAVAAVFARWLHVPQILVGIQPLARLDYARTTTYMQLANDDICAMPEAAGVYERLWRAVPPCIVASSGQVDYIKKEVNEWVAAARARAAFKYETFGYLGHTYEGMYDMHTDPTAFTAAFGAHVKMLEMCELVSLADAATDEDIAAKTAEIRRTFCICDPSHDPITDYVQDADLALSARLACGLDKLVNKHSLAALAYFYKGEPGTKQEEYAANLIIGNTLLTTAGTPLAGEADLKTAAAMLIMKNIGGGGSFAEIHPFDTVDDVVLIGHDGPHNIHISEGQPKLRKLKKYHGKSGAGIGVEFSLQAGPVTLLSISSTRDGRFKMVAAEGVSLPGDIPQTGNTNTKVTFGCPVNEFLSRWCEAGPTHHLALGIGHRISCIEKFARLSGIALTVVR